MNRLARKYRDMGSGQAKPAFAPINPDDFGFFIDRKGSFTVQTDEKEPTTEDHGEKNETPSLEDKKATEEHVSSSSEEETKDESEPKKKKSRDDKWLENKEVNEEALSSLERVVFNQTDKFAENLRRYTGSDDDAEDEVEDEKRAVWADDDDEEEQSAINRRKYEQLVGQPSWARKAEERLEKKSKNLEGNVDGSDDSSSDDDDDGFRKMRDYTAKESTSIGRPRLPGGQTLEFVRCSDLNQELRHLAQISSIDFYPRSTLAAVASHDSTLKLFQVDGKTNTLVHSIVMQQWPIALARFNAHTQEILLQCAIPQAGFYGYDLMSEKSTFYNRYRSQGCTPFRNMTLSPDGQLMAFSSRCGYIHVISSRTKELMFDLKRNGEVASLAMVDNLLLASGNDCEVFVWDIRQQRQCINRFNDSGCIHGTSLTASPDSSLIACGSDSGIVNLYRMDKCLQECDPKPIKAFKNIVTPISGLVVNHSSELMVAWSSQMPRTVKAVNLGSRSVYANFPEPEDMRLKNLSAAALSPNSGFLAVGNSTGRVLLWRLRHFSSY